MRPHVRAWRRRAASVTVVLATALLALGTTATTASGTGDASGTDRIPEIVDTIAEGDVYLEPSLGAGHAASWAGRLQEAADAVEVPGGVAIAGWVDVPGSTPDQARLGEDVVDAYVAAGGTASVVATSAGGNFDLYATPRASDRLRDRIIEVIDRRFGVETEAIRRFTADRGLGERPPGEVGVEEVGLHQAAALWMDLRLLAPDPPSLDSLASQVASDPTFFVDTSGYTLFPDPPRGERDDPTRRASSLILLAAVVGGYLAIRAVRALRDGRRRREAERSTADARLVPSPAEVEEGLTRLAEELARVPVRLDDLGYRRAQRCRDAAERYVDRDAERDRVGALLLCRDGLVWLAGDEPGPRCFFDPGHRVDDGLVTIGATTAPAGVPTAVDDLDAQVPCCRRCAAQVGAGDRPDALRVTGGGAGEAHEEGERRAYYEVDDSWTRTGYGSLSAEWAQQVLDESWSRTRREDR